MRAVSHALWCLDEQGLRQLRSYCQDKLDKELAHRPTADELVNRGILSRESTLRN